MLQSRNQIVNNRLSRSLQNINYSQWERKKTCLPRSGEKSLQDTRDRNEKKPNVIPHQPMVFKMPPIIDKHGSLGHRNDTTQLSFLVGRPSAKPRREVFKTKRQLKEEEENRTLLKLKITFAREEIERLKIRESELKDINKSLLDYISKTENNANLDVDSVLRRYENYQNLKKTIQDKHFEEIETEKKELDELKAKFAKELPKYEAASNEIEEKLRDAQELNRLLSVYKNQEYPEKLLHINKLRKELGDLNNLHNEEFQNLQDMINHEKETMKRTQAETTITISSDVSKKALDEMHYSLKDMATFNTSIKSQIEFYMNHLENLQIKNSQLEAEIKSLKADKRRNLRNYAFDEILFKPKPICTPDMDIFIDYSDDK